MRKHLLFLFLCSLFVCLVLTPARASVQMIAGLNNDFYITTEENSHIIQRIVQYANGDRLLEMAPVTILQGRGLETYDKEYYYIDSNNNTLWKATLTATFTYNGVTATCTAVSCSTTIYNSNWHENSVNTYPSGAAAIADVSMVRKFLFITIETVNINITMLCDKDGNVV